MDSPKGRTVSGTPTGERARSGGSAQADLSVARPAPAGADMKHCVCRRSASFFFFSSFLICHCRHSRSKNGVTSFAYDPAIHGALWLVQPRRKGSRHVSMDHRVKPSGDEENASLFEIAISNLANRNQRMRRALP
jgi:hypothetical protein